MKTIDAFAPLRPRPSGPPLRGRAALHEGIRNWRPCWPPRQGTSGGGFHLKLADPWSKIGGRRIGRAEIYDILVRQASQVSLAAQLQATNKHLHAISKSHCYALTFRNV